MYCWRRIQQVKLKDYPALACDAELSKLLNTISPRTAIAATYYCFIQPLIIAV